MKRTPLILSAALLALIISCTPQKLPVIPGGDSTGEPAQEESVNWDGTRRADISYQLLLYSFADSDGDGKGDIGGVTSHLDYFESLGVGALWLSPIHPCSSYHGYDVTDYEAINPDFGTEDDFRQLLAKAHEKGIKIYLDFVLNHTSNSHPWFLSAISDPASPYRDYYVLSDSPAADIAAGKIAQINTEGAGGYDSGQWFSTNSGAGESGRMKFTLNWGSAPTVTVSRTDAPADSPNTSTSAGGKYLYYGTDKCVRFHEKGANTYELTLDFESDWGFLIRTSSTSWESGTKYGAPQGKIITFDTPFALQSNASGDCDNIRFSNPLMYHSHFWTGAFADLNYGPASTCENSLAFKDLCKAADKWIKMGVDGFRLDAVKHIYHNAYSNENPTFLGKFYDHCNATFKANGGKGEFYMVGEMLDGGVNVAPYYAGLPALFEFDFWYKLKWAIGAGVGRYFAKDILELQGAYKSHRANYIEATKLSNHDEDRTGSELGKNKDKMKLAAAVLLTAQGHPYIYQGEELGYWGTKSGGDEYVRSPIIWNKDGQGAFGSLWGKYDKNMLKGEISVEAQTADKASVLSTYLKFAALRNSCPALATGTMSHHGTYNMDNSSFESIAAWYMTGGGEKLLVVHNFGSAQLKANFSVDNLEHLLASNGSVSVEKNTLTLGAYSSAVFKQ